MNCKEGENLAFIQTRASKAGLTPVPFKSVIYESKVKSKGSKKSVPLEENADDDKVSEFNMKKARQEVIKFGISGFDLQKKEEVKIAQAIKLGAKPPKNKCKNYKLLLQEKSKEKVEKNNILKFQQLGKTATGKSLVNTKKFENKKKKKKKLSILDPYGKVVVNKKINSIFTEMKPKLH